MIRKAIILAAGRGIRLMPLSQRIPKEMIPIYHKPLIEKIVCMLKNGGIGNILVIISPLKKKIVEYLGSGEKFSVHISYEVQETPTGTAHAVYLGKKFIGAESFVVIYGDTYFGCMDIMQKAISLHERKKADVTIVLKRVKDPRKFGLVRISTEGEVIKIIEKPTLKEASEYEVNGYYLAIAGLLIFRPIIFDFIERTHPGKNGETWLTDSIKLMRENGCRIYGFVSNCIIRDIGSFKSLTTLCTNRGLLLDSKNF